MLLVNLGCGSVFHPDWINLDSIPASDLVRRWDIRGPLPFADGQVDACYASHVFEHLPKPNALDFLRECRRILKPGGVVRLAVPDLENIATAYLNSVHGASNDRASLDRHEWMTIELIDQMVRRVGGGDMHRALCEADGDRRKFAVERIGMEAESVFSPAPRATKKPGWFSVVAHYGRRSREELAGLVASMVLGSEGRAALREGIFRRSGQVHQWMYDRVSLKAFLEQAGFVDVVACRADQSRIDRFTSFDLDTVNGRVRKPDSLFMEAARP